ncbi:hypothetical protein BESB_031120 [Besnoitia besnoiti]|uniref:Uncharacterized protein n=1 Tax=Besnoitia besnoiti TaxID=94643 RepID=A0A2A9LXN0_BESBE|nr:hypothetical protein BESB_031120 [Besnoitia besnoiti]PFH31238.1 hypothetical protein BESB_031120 [Besnoitia besnoiti]
MATDSLPAGRSPRVAAGLAKKRMRGAGENPTQRKAARGRQTVDEKGKRNARPFVRADLSLPDWDDDEVEAGAEAEAEALSASGSAAADASVGASVPADAASSRAEDAAAEDGAGALPSPPRNSYAEKKQKRQIQLLDVPSAGYEERSGRRQGDNKKKVFWKDPVNRRILRGVTAALDETPSKARRVEAEAAPRGQKRANGAARVSVKEERENTAQEMTDWMAAQMDLRRHKRPVVSRERLTRQKKR